MAADLGSICASLELKMSQFEKGLTVAINGFERLRQESKKTGEAAAESGNKIDKSGEKTKEAGEKASKMAEKVGKVGDTLTKRVTVPVAAMATASVKAAIDWESAWTGVTKTVDGTSVQMDRLHDGILNMSKNMPQSATSIAEVAEAAGQLGIQTDNVLDFTKTMIMLGDSTNLSADEAATTLARFANIVQMSQSDFSKLGSVLVDLGNNFATTEAEIAAMGLRLAGAGKQIGLTEPQIMGFATALSSVGIEAEAGGSAISKVFVDMQLACETGGESLQNFANAAGMSAEQFKAAFQQDAAEAMISFIKGLQSCEERGISAIKVLDDMGITEVRMRDALLRAAGAGDLFGNAIQTANKAWSENTALANEANKRYGTSASRIAMMKNRIVEAAISIGNKLLPSVLSAVESIERLVTKFSKLDSGTQETIIKMALFTATIGPALKAVSGLGKGILGLANGFSKASTFLGIMSKATASGSGKMAAFGKAVSSASGASGIGGFVSALKLIAPVAAPAAVAIGSVATAVKLANTYHAVGKKTVLDTKDSYTLLERVMAKFRGTTIYTKKELEDMGLVQKKFAKNVSKDFQNAIIESNKQLADMSLELGKINLDKVITQEEKDSFVGRVDKMIEAAIQSLESKKEKTSSLMKELFSYDGTIDEAEQHNLEILTKETDAQIEEVNRLKEEVNAILQKKVEEHRELNDQEVQDVKNKIARIKELELLGQVQSNDELLLMKNEFNERVKTLNLKAGSELLKDKRKSIKEELISIKSKYDTAIQMQQNYLKDASEEEKQGILDRIEQLKKDKEERCKGQEDLWRELVRIAEEGNENLKGKINKYNGEILNDDDFMKQRLLQKQQENFDGLNNIAETGLYRLYDKHNKTYKDVFVTVDETTGDIIAAWDTESKEVGAYTEKDAQKNKELAQSYIDTKATISDQLLKTMGVHMDATGRIIDNNGQICGSLQNVKQNSDGTKTALIEMSGREYKIEINSDGAITSCNEVTRAIHNIPSYKMVTVDVKTPAGFQNAAQKTFNKNVFQNAAGTNNFQGGLTTMHERGYELYNLPGGSKIFNHEASEAAVEKMVKKVFDQGMSQLKNSGYGGDTGALYVTIKEFYNNRKQDIKQLAEELEFYRRQQSRGRGNRG